MRSLLICLLFTAVNVGAQDIDHDRAHTNYMLNCQGCHRADGSGLPDSVPSMQNFVGKFLTVPGGREFLVQVPGSANSPLSDAALAELLNWILTTMSSQQLPKDFKPYTAAEVTAVRYEEMLDIADVRATLVSKFSAPRLPSNKRCM